MTTTASTLPVLPVGSVVELGSQVRAYDGGRILVGGVPQRLVRLSGRARSMLEGRRIRLTDSPSVQLAGRLLALGMAHPVVSELPPAAPADLTVVVPVRDRAVALNRLLTGIGRKSAVIVVDDGSRDPRAVARVAHAHGAALTALPENLGPAAARNAGLGLVRTRFVAFVDSDVVIGGDALSMLLRHFHDPCLAMVAPRVLGLEDGEGAAGAAGAAGWIARYEAARSSLDLGPDPALVRPGSRVSWVPSACLVARVDALGPGFAPGMRVGEDVDLVWRLAAEGQRVRYEPAVAVRHDHRVRLTAWLARKAYYGTGGHELAERHGAAVAPAVFTPWAAGVAAAVLAQRRWSVPVAAALCVGTSVRLSRKVPVGGSVSRRVAVELTGLGLAATGEQTMGLLLRHWWPLSVAGSLVSRRIRRAVVVAALADGLLEYRLRSPDLDPVRFLLARRLDDLAYGAGLWAGAVRGRSPRSLLPEVVPAAAWRSTAARASRRADSGM